MVWGRKKHEHEKEHEKGTLTLETPKSVEAVQQRRYTLLDRLELRHGALCNERDDINRRIHDITHDIEFVRRFPELESIINSLVERYGPMQAKDTMMGIANAAR